MLDFNSFQWSARKCDADADACNPFSLLYSFICTCECECEDVYERWRKLLSHGMRACMRLCLNTILCECMLREHVYRDDVSMCVCVGIIRARYGVLLESQCQCQWSCEQTKSNQNNIHFLYGENKKILPWLKDGERVYTMYTTHTPSVYKWKSTTTTTNSKHPNQHFDISTESNKSIRGQWKKEHKT